MTAAELLRWHVRQGSLTDAAAATIRKLAEQGDPLFGVRDWHEALAVVRRRARDAVDGRVRWRDVVTLARVAFDAARRPLAAELAERALDRLRGLPPVPDSTLVHGRWVVHEHARLADVEAVIRAVAEAAGVRLLEDPSWN